MSPPGLQDVVIGEAARPGGGVVGGAGYRRRVRSRPVGEGVCGVGFVPVTGTATFRPAVPPREGLMNDRYKSLQARNLIEPRKMAGKNKTRKMNSVTKNSAKDLKYTSPHSKWNTSKDAKYTSGMELPAWM